MFERLKELLVGKPRDIDDPDLFHKISLVAFLAWVGLGADGLSSSAYGPDEAFRALNDPTYGDHTYLAIFLALATGLTVLIISLAYSSIIEHFPSGGGGYVVSTKLLGEKFGLVSGSALLIDYVLTITTSIASAANALFELNFIPKEYELHGVMHKTLDLKVPFEAFAIVVLIILNLRGVKESIKILVPIFLFFLLTHIVLLGGVFTMHAGKLPGVFHEVSTGVRTGLSNPQLGLIGLLLLFARAYSMGAGTFTGIEAVSNGLQIMREPRVRTGKRTMIYMALSLAFMAGGILLGYKVLGITAIKDKPLNASLAESLGIGATFVISVLISEALLLFIAAQTGFIDGPRVMANMALDSWLPHRFSALSERLTMHYGILLMGLASIAVLVYTGGEIDMLVTMYSINVFITFSLSTLGMCRFYIQKRGKNEHWKRGLSIQVIAFSLCSLILVTVVLEKFARGAWLTLVVTSLLIIACIAIKRYYKTVYANLGMLSVDVEVPQPIHEPAKGLDIKKSTAVLMVGQYGGLGVHALAQIIRLFPNHFEQIVFISAGIIDSGNFKGAEESERLKEETQATLDRYEALARRFGLASTGMMLVGQDPVATLEELCAEVSLRYSHATFFAGQLVFQKDAWYQRLLHNETAFAVQRRLLWQGLPMVVLPVRVWGRKKQTKNTIVITKPQSVISSQKA